MRIGFDAKRAFANKTGLGNYSRFVLEALLAHQKDQTYLAYTPKNRAKLFTNFPENSIRLPEKFLDKKLTAYWRYATITQQLKHDQVHVFHGLSNELPQGLGKAGIKSVVTIHDLIFERLPHLFKPVDRLIYRHKFQSACRRADKVIAISEQTKRDLMELYQVSDDKIQVVYQDSNPIFKQPVDSEKKQEIRDLYNIQKPYVLCVGTLEERKNQHRLVEAFAAIQRNDFDLILIGKPTTYTPRIFEYIKKFNLVNSVKVLSNVPTEHLPALYQEAAVFAYISVYEGFGIPILEALHSGTPVLAAKGSCLEEAGGPGGLYADPYQKDDISHQLNKLITDVHLRERLAEAGKQHIQQFSGQSIAGQLVDLYKNL